MTEANFNTVYDAFEVLSGGESLFYVLSHPYEFNELVIRLAEYLDEWDCYLQNN